MRTDASILQEAKRGKGLCGRGQGPRAGRDTTYVAGHWSRACSRITIGVSWSCWVC